jgi:branched-chain amino acid aminotransferase
MAEKPPLQLQKPKWVFFGGKIRPWEEALFHISSEAVVRGLNVFEGLKGAWQVDGRFGILAVERHWRRLRRSAKLLHIPFEMSLDDFDDACHDLVRMLYEPQRNMWIRATLYVTDGHWGVGTKSDLVLTAFHHPKGLPEPVSTGISTWQRATDLSLPYRIKTSTNYEVARLAKIEGRDRGYSEMVLLNQHGRVAETIGSAVIIVRDGQVLTPPSWEGAIESITVDIVESLCATMGVPFARRPIDRTELIIADEMAIVGTLNDITLISALDGQPFGEAPILKAVAERYLRALTGEEPHPSVDLSCRPPASSAEYTPVFGAPFLVHGRAAHAWPKLRAILQLLMGG